MKHARSIEFSSAAIPFETRRRLMQPSRRRVDPDRLVGVACLLILPVAIWLA